MKFSSLLVPVACVLAMSSLAHAKITNLPKQLKVATQTIQGNALEEVSETLACEFDTEDSQAVKAQFVLTEGELADDPEYKGELASFVLVTTVTLPATCANSGTYACKISYDLYDEKAYEVDSSKTVCAQ